MEVTDLDFDPSDWQAAVSRMRSEVEAIGDLTVIMGAIQKVADRALENAFLDPSCVEPKN